MAMSGNFETAFKTGYRVGIDWSAGSQSASTNSSIVYATLYLRSTSSSYTISSSAAKNVSITIDGQTFSGTANVSLKANEKKTIFTAQKTVYHDSNGNKSLGISGSAAIKITFGSGYVDTVSTSSTVTLDKINLNSPPTMSGHISTSPGGIIPETATSIRLSWNKASDAQGNADKYQIYRYVNGSHWDTFNINNINQLEYTDNFSGLGEGTRIDYTMWAGDSFGTWSNAIYSYTATKNTMTGAWFTGHSNDVYWNTTYFDLYVGGASNTDGTGGFKYRYYSDDVTVYNSSDTTSTTGRINIWRDLAGGAQPSGAYIKQSDLKEKFKNSNFNGRIHVGVRTQNAHGTYKWSGGAVGVDLRTDIVVSSGSVAFDNNSYYTIGSSRYVIPGRKNIQINWPAAIDPLGTGITYRLEQSINGGGWTTLHTTTGTSHSFSLNVSGKPTYTFRVIARNGYGYEKQISGTPYEAMYTYSAPTVAITSMTRTASQLTVNISTGVSTDIPGNAIKTLSWSFGNKNGNLSTSAKTFNITGLTEGDSGTFTISITDNHGASVGQATVTVNGSLSRFYPVLSIRKNGVGINTIADSSAALSVSGGLKVDGKVVTKVVDEGAYRYGVQNATDENFRKGMNDLGVYNNAGGGTVTLTRIDDATAPNDTKKVIKISNTGAAAPGHGGFTWQHPSYACGVWNYILIAKLPVGKYLTYHNNAYGEGATFEWISDNVGTGEWKTYIGKAKAGKTGSFSTIGFFAINGGNTGFDWYLAKATYYEATSGANVVYKKIDGVVELGQYTDFHINDKNNDYDARLQITGGVEGQNGRGDIHIEAKTLTAGNDQSFKMGYNITPNGAGMVSNKSDAILGSGWAVFLNANNYFDGANDVHYSKGSGASCLLLHGNNYPRFRWSNQGDNQWGICQWSPWYDVLTSHHNQQVVMGRADATVGDGANWDHAQNSGVYLVSIGSNWGTNAPPNSYAWGNLVVFNNGHGVVSQMYFPHSGSHFFQYRTRWADGNWTNWANPGWSAYSLTNNDSVNVLNSDINLLSFTNEGIVTSSDFYQAVKDIITTTGKNNTVGILEESVLNLENANLKEYLINRTEEYSFDYIVEPAEYDEDGELIKEEIKDIATIPASEKVKPGIEGTLTLIALQEEIKIRDTQYDELKTKYDEMAQQLAEIKRALSAR